MHNHTVQYTSSEFQSLAITLDQVLVSMRPTTVEETLIFDVLSALLIRVMLRQNKLQYEGHQLTTFIFKPMEKSLILCLQNMAISTTLEPYQKYIIAKTLNPQIYGSQNKVKSKKRRHQKRL